MSWEVGWEVVIVCPVSTAQEPPADRDGPAPPALPLGCVVHRGVRQTPSHLVRQRPRPRHHTLPEDKEQRSVFSRHAVPGPWGCFTAVVGISQWSDSVVVAIVTDTSLSELFGGEKDNNNSTSSEAERRLKDIKDGKSRGSVQGACHRK